jgi:hypothetical protein
MSTTIRNICAKLWVGDSRKENKTTLPKIPVLLGCCMEG